jgi:hypothetical protein
MPAAFEEILAFIAAQLPAPVQQDFEDDGSVLFVGGDPGEVIVRLTTSAVTVAQYAVTWETPYTPTVQPIQIGVFDWQAVPGDAAMRVVKALITAAREARLADFATCRSCLKRTPPEWMHGDELCQSCAERDGGVVH